MIALLLGSSPAQAQTRPVATTALPEPPRIVRPPQNQALLAGHVAQLTVAATGSAPLSYQWYSGLSGNTDHPLPGATGTNYSTGPLTIDSAYWVRVTNAAGMADSQTATITVLYRPTITSQPQSQILMAGQSTVLTVAADGTGPFNYQWYRGQSGDTSDPVPTATTTYFDTAPLTTTGSFWVRVRNVAGSADSATAVVQALQPPSITRPPGSVVVALGQQAVFSADVTGSEPLAYRWRLNGQNIPGATGPSYTVPSVSLADAGSYTVVVSNDVGVSESAPALLTVAGLSLVEMTDAFGSTRRVYADVSFTGTNINAAATREPGEPLHAGEPGGRSLWLTWQAPADGIVTFSTTGSSFDTLLAVYTGTSLTELAQHVAAADDDHGGNLTSQVKFNAHQGVRYEVAVDGHAGESGVVVLSWSLEPTPEAQPVILSQPQSVLANEGDAVTLSVTADLLQDGYQWYLNGNVLAGQTEATLRFPALRQQDAGLYRVRVTAPNGLWTESAEALVEVVPAGVPLARTQLSADKWQDLFVGESLGAGVGLASRRRPVRPAGFTTVTIGIGGQTTDLWGSTRSAGDPEACGAVSGVSRWFRLRVDSPRPVALFTTNSEVNVVLGVYRLDASATPASLEYLGCALGQAGGAAARVDIQAVDGEDYLVMLAGIGEAAGRVGLGWDGGDVQSESHIPLVDGHVQVRWFVAPGRYAFRQSGDIAGWQPLFQTNITGGVFQYDDPEPATKPARFYHLLRQLP